jgi:hypothetical protein
MTTGGRRERSLNQDELLSRLYQQLTKQQAARFGAVYDLAAGLHRYQVWLAGQVAEDQARREANQPTTSTVMQASAGGIGPISAPPRPGAAVTADETAWRPSAAGGEIPRIEVGGNADRAVTALYSVHYRGLFKRPDNSM